MADGHDSRYSDAANRCSDVIRLHIMGGAAGRWAAIHLADGSSDGTAYDSRADAVRHQFDEFLCCYVCIPPDDMSPRQAELFLKFNRDLYNAGMRMTDPSDDLANALMPTRVEHLARLGIALPAHLRGPRPGPFALPVRRRTR